MSIERAGRTIGMGEITGPWQVGVGGVAVILLRQSDEAAGHTMTASVDWF